MQLNKEFLDKQRQQGDAAADNLITTIFTTGGQNSLYALLKLEDSKIAEQPHSSIKNFLMAQKVKPAWFNQRRLRNGQQLFRHYALEMMTLLGVMSLPYCYAASPGNKALYLSDKMRTTPGKRLMDTASFVIDVLTPGSFSEGNTAHIQINKLRLIHSLSRHYLKKQGQWDMKWGQPINQEDMAGTNLAFSYVILLGMQQSGFNLSRAEREDFIFSWRYIGYLLNIDDQLLPASFAEAAQLTNVIKKRNFKTTEEGTILTAELLAYYKANVPSWQAELVQAQVRMYLGSEIAGYIGLSFHPVRDRIASAIDTFRSIQNMLTIKKSSYNDMLFNHMLLKKKFAM